jgi:hypothetical protein
MLPSEKCNTLPMALLMTGPAVLLMVVSLFPAPTTLHDIGGPGWTMVCILTGALAGIGWLSYDFRRRRQRRHLEAFWRAYRTKFPDAPIEMPDERVILRYLDDLQRKPAAEPRRP